MMLRTMEPDGTSIRPITMRRMIVPLALLLALAAACGDAGGNPTDGTGPRSTPTAQAGECTPGSAPVQHATPVGSFDLDGDGTPEKLFVTAAQGACPNTLFAAVRDGYASLALGGTTLDPKSFTGVKLPGHDGAVVRADEVHPRGGFQAHLYGYADGKLAELLAGGEPVLPFIATDTTRTPLAASCTNAGFEITLARPHEPSGVLFAWDLHRTSYTLSGNHVSAGASTKIEDNVLPGQLRKEHRAMFRYRVFANCPTS